MSVKEATPEESSRLVQEERYVYLDVRTEAEFEQGHPPGAYNVPVIFRDDTGQPEPNTDFLSVVEAHFPRDTKFVLGCRSGGRSARAQQMLLHAGYGEVVNNLHGWEGRTDWDGTFLPGWSKTELPVETGQPEERSYTSLKDKAKQG